MTNNGVVLFVVISIQFLYTSHFQISPDQGTFFHLDDDILSMVGKILILLKNGNNFTTSRNTADNLLIHNFIHKVKGIYGDKYNGIRNISRATDYDDKTEYVVLIISKVLRRIIKEERKKYNKSELTMKHRSVIDDSYTQDQDNRGGLFDFVRFERAFKRGAELIAAMVADHFLFGNSKQQVDSITTPQVDQDVEAWEPLAPTRRIYGGRATAIADFPFVVSVHADGEFCCAGAILSKRAVISAASCLWRFHAEPRQPPVPIAVRVGSDFTGVAGTLLSVQRMIFHKHFDLKSLANNLVILRLRERLKFGEGVRKIKFDMAVTPLPKNIKDVFVLGWGANNVSKFKGVKDKDAALSSATEQIYDIKSCRNAYSSYYVKHTHFCTGAVNRGSGACKNDIGGSAVVGSKLVGLISFGPARCGRRNNPTVYTKLGFYGDWIARVTQEITKKKVTKMPEKKRNDKDFDTIKQFAGELQQVMLKKASIVADQSDVITRGDHSDDEKDAAKSALRMATRLGSDEERDPEFPEENIKITTRRMVKPERNQRTIPSKNLMKRFKMKSTVQPSTIMNERNNNKIHNLPSKAENIQLEMASDSSSVISKTVSTESEDDSSESEEIMITLDGAQTPKEKEEKNYAYKRFTRS